MDVSLSSYFWPCTVHGNLLENFFFLPFYVLTFTLQAGQCPITFHSPPTSCSADQSLSFCYSGCFKGNEKGLGPAPSLCGSPPTQRQECSYDLPLFPPPPLFSFITQLSFVGLIRLYLVWVHWGENFWGSMWKGRGVIWRSCSWFGSRTIWSKCLTCGPWRWQTQGDRRNSVCCHYPLICWLFSWLFSL